MINQLAEVQPASWAFHPAVTDLIIPIFFTIFAVIGKKICRDKPGWFAEDFFLGPDLCIAAMGAGMVKVYDLLKQMPVAPDKVNIFSMDVAIACVLLVFTFGIYLAVLSEHKDLLPNETAKFRRWRLMGVCNAAGFLSLVAFIVLIKPL